MLPVKKNTLVWEGISCPIDDVGNKFWGTWAGQIQTYICRDCPIGFLVRGGRGGIWTRDEVEISPAQPHFLKLSHKEQKMEAP